MNGEDRDFLRTLFQQLIVQLLSGFRGTGKSTELRRLKDQLQASGYLVVLCDIEDYINLSTPIM